MTKGNRIEEIDIIKAISITLMVLGHSGFTHMKIISLFHVAVFIIASGVFFKNISTNSFKSSLIAIKKRLKQLLLPYAFFNAIFTLFNNLFLKIGVYTDNPEIYNYINSSNVVINHHMSLKEMAINILKGFFFAGGTSLGGALWFLKVLCTISIMYIIFDYLIKKILKNNDTIICQGVVSLLLLLIGYYCSIKNIELIFLARSFSCYCLYYIGVLISRNIYLFNSQKINYLGMLFASFLTLAILSRFGSIALNNNQYVNPLYLLLSSFSGWCFLYSVAYFIKQTTLKDLISLIGKKTLIILCLHFLTMKLCAYIVVLVYNLPIFCVSSHPNLYGERGVWFIAYTVFGIAIPVLISLLVDKFKKCF